MHSFCIADSKAEQQGKFKGGGRPSIWGMTSSMTSKDSISTLGKAGIETNDYGESSDDGSAQGQSEHGSDSDESRDFEYVSRNSRSRSRCESSDSGEEQGEEGPADSPAASKAAEPKQLSWADIVGATSANLGGARYFAPDRVDTSFKCFNCGKPGHST